LGSIICISADDLVIGLSRLWLVSEVTHLMGREIFRLIRTLSMGIGGKYFFGIDLTAK